MKILAIGDPHGDLRKIRKIPLKGIDLILLTGDLGKADLARKRYFENVERKKKGLKKLEDNSKFKRDVHMEIYNSTLNILRYLSKYAPIYIIQGNVGVSNLSDTREIKRKYGITLPSTKVQIDKMRNVYMVKNRLRIFDGKRIGFLEYFVDTNWVRDFKPADFKKSMKKSKKETDKAKRVLKRFRNLDILVCHQPPYGFLDKVTFAQAPKHWIGKHAGSQTILDYIRKYQPKYVFCGHIHEGEGRARIGKTEIYNLGVGGHKIIEL